MDNAYFCHAAKACAKMQIWTNVLCKGERVEDRVQTFPLEVYATTLPFLISKQTVTVCMHRLCFVCEYSTLVCSFYKINFLKSRTLLFFTELLVEILH